MEPALTVVMPVYNGARYLPQAIDSTLAQTFQNFIFFIINDGSTDDSENIILDYMRKDQRIVYFRQQKSGLIATLNKYCRKAETKFIARMDCDDISLPHRFEKQITFLQKHPEIGVLGSAVRRMSESMKEMLEEVSFPRRHFEIVWKMTHTSGFSHPSIMFKKEVFEAVGGYSTAALHVEDYDFFLRLKEITRFANLPDILLLYRSHSSSVSHLNSSFQREKHFELSKDFIRSISADCYLDDGVRFLKYHTVSSVANYPAVYLFMNELYKRFIKFYNVTNLEKKYIYHDLMIKLSILSLTYKNISFWKGLLCYARIFLRAPWVLFFNLRHKK